MLMHASAIAMGGQAIMLVGPSGAGKSQLALRVIQLGGWLIADDQVVLSIQEGRIWASCPPTIVGRLEVRGVGIVAAPHQRRAPVRLVLNLDPADRPAPDLLRLPTFRRWLDPAALENTRPIPCVPFDAFRPDAAEAVVAALAQSREWEDSPPL